MGTRRKSRELTLQFLYQGELAGQDNLLDFEEYCIHFQVNKKAIPYAKKLLDGVQEKGDAINQLIRKYAENWRLERMSVIDRNILRLAVYEVHYQDDVPISVAINEAVEIAKRFSTDDSAPFINGILDGVAKEKIKDAEDTVKRTDSKL
ncbi:MAG: transcription antitermination factor NusB [Desulfobacterales bacterium]|jgi:N utilization substance protein B|nr:transcription antitermination factor NusB [Desulfobulbaceae bacterium]MDX2434962.1 transcription antitermination factor NusB [Desulfobacterales bacterium]NOQ66340.1 transcription antitermination factor NusB [Desulfobacterales bacterium]